MADMDKTEAFRIARKTLFQVFELENVKIGAQYRAVPKARLPNGDALHSEQAEAADAYNWLADNHGGT